MTETNGKLVSEFEAFSGNTILNGTSERDETIAIKSNGDDYLVYYFDPATTTESVTQFDSAWSEIDRSGTITLFVAGKLQGLKEFDGQKLGAEVEKRFSNLKEIDSKLYNEALPVAQLFQKTGEIYIPSALIKHATPTMNGKPLHLEG